MDVSIKAILSIIGAKSSMLKPPENNDNGRDESARTTNLNSKRGSEMKKVPLYINGEFVQSKTDKWIDVTNPATQEVIAQAPCATQDEMKQAVESAQKAFLTWKEVAVSE